MLLQEVECVVGQCIACVGLCNIRCVMIAQFQSLYTLIPPIYRHDVQRPFQAGPDATTLFYGQIANPNPSKQTE